MTIKDFGFSARLNRRVFWRAGKRGGRTITGGLGNVGRTAVGALIISIVRIGMPFIGVNIFAESDVFGAMLIAAVAVTIDRSKIAIIKSAQIPPARALPMLFPPLPEIQMRPAHWVARSTRNRCHCEASSILPATDPAEPEGAPAWH